MLGRTFRHFLMVTVATIAMSSFSRPHAHAPWPSRARPCHLMTSLIISEIGVGGRESPRMGLLLLHPQCGFHTSGTASDTDNLERYGTVQHTRCDDLVDVSGVPSCVRVLEYLNLD